MTLGRDRRGSDWRPSRPGAGHDDRRGTEGRPPWAGSPAPYGDVEVEELPAQPVLASGRGRPGLAAAGAAAVLVALLAAGFGVLGGRPAPSPTSHAVAAASPSGAVPSPAEAVPLVTPAVPCALSAIGLPEIILDNQAGEFAGTLEVLEWTQPGPMPTPVFVPEASPSAPIDIRSDVNPELRTIGEACAFAWIIEVTDPTQAIRLERFGSEAEPDVARQNRFELTLSRYRGRLFELHATLSFPGVLTRTTWPVRVLPYDAPKPTLTRGGKAIDVKPGCDVELILGNGYSELVNPCPDELNELPVAATIRGQGTGMTFALPEGWFLMDTSVTCGLLSEQRLTPDPNCEVAWSDQGTSVSIDEPSTAGTWTLGINSCGSQFLDGARNQVCGTWYATIEVGATRS